MRRRVGKKNRERNVKSEKREQRWKMVREYNEEEAKKGRKESIKGREIRSKTRACVCLDGQKACRAWQESCFWQQLRPQFYILRWCLDSAPAFLSPALMFSIRGDHKLLSAVITAVHCGPAEGSQPVRVHQVTLDHDTSDMGSGEDLRAEETQHESLKEVLLIQEPEACMKMI